VPPGAYCISHVTTFEPVGGAVLGGEVLLITRPLAVAGGPVSVAGLVGLEAPPIESPLAGAPVATPDAGELPVIAGAVGKVVLELSWAGRSKTYPAAVTSSSNAMKVVATAGFLSCRGIRLMLVPPRFARTTD